MPSRGFARAPREPPSARPVTPARPTTREGTHAPPHPRQVDGAEEMARLLESDEAEIVGDFETDSLSKQLEQVAKVIKTRGARRGKL